MAVVCVDPPSIRIPARNGASHLTITRTRRWDMFFNRMLGALAAPVKQRYGAKQWKEADLGPPEWAVTRA